MDKVTRNGNRVVAMQFCDSAAVRIRPAPWRGVLETAGADRRNQALVQHGARSVLAIYPGEGHGVRSHPALADFMARVLSWFDEHLRAGAAR
jgi:prolyl oligopeptidase family protein